MYVSHINIELMCAGSPQSSFLNLKINLILILSHILEARLILVFLSGVAMATAVALLATAASMLYLNDV